MAEILTGEMLAEKYRGVGWVSLRAMTGDFSLIIPPDIAANHRQKRIRHRRLNHEREGVRQNVGAKPSRVQSAHDQIMAGIRDMIRRKFEALVKSGQAERRKSEGDLQFRII